MFICSYFNEEFINVYVVCISRDVESGRTYTYQVQAMLGSKGSALSPALTYRHGDSFCGDGHINRYDITTLFIPMHTCRNNYNTMS